MSCGLRATDLLRRWPSSHINPLVPSHMRVSRSFASLWLPESRSSRQRPDTAPSGLGQWPVTSSGDAEAPVLSGWGWSALEPLTCCCSHADMDALPRYSLYSLATRKDREQAIQAFQGACHTPCSANTAKARLEKVRLMRVPGGIRSESRPTRPAWLSCAWPAQSGNHHLTIPRLAYFHQGGTQPISRLVPTRCPNPQHSQPRPAGCPKASA